MDELAALRTFRSEIPEREADAYVAVRRLIPERRPRRSRRRWVLVAAVALVGVALASSAFGWTDRLLDSVAGEPAPPPVREAFAVQNEARARQVMPIFRQSRSMEVIARRAHGVMGINTSAGRVIIWSAPTKGGGTCWVIDIERLRRPGGVPNGAAGCSPSALPPDVPLHYGVLGSRVGNAMLQLVHGTVSVGVASVELRYPDGRGEILPVFERHFLSELRRGSRPSVMIARDSRGGEIERKEITAPVGLPGPPGPALPKPAGPERVQIQFESSSGHQFKFSVAPGDQGRLCQITRYRGSRSQSCGWDRRRRVGPDEISVHPGLWNEAGDGKPFVHLDGVVGDSIARLDLEYTDGTVVQVPITEQFVYFEIPPVHHKDARFVLKGRDRSGAEIARRVID